MRSGDALKLYFGLFCFLVDGASLLSCTALLHAVGCAVDGDLLCSICHFQLATLPAALATIPGRNPLILRLKKLADDGNIPGLKNSVPEKKINSSTREKPCYTATIGEKICVKWEQNTEIGVKILENDQNFNC